MASLMDWCRELRRKIEVVCVSPFQNCPAAATFAQIDSPALLALPLQRYEMAHFKTVKPHIDYHRGRTPAVTA